MSRQIAAGAIFGFVLTVLVLALWDRNGSSVLPGSETPVRSEVMKPISGPLAEGDTMLRQRDRLVQPVPVQVLAEDAGQTESPR